MKFMLDTNICIYLQKQKPIQVLDTLKTIPPEELCISVITLAELMNGALKSQQVENNLAKLKKLVETIPVKLFDETAAESYGYVRSDLEKRGVVIGSNDLFIAAHALSLNVTLVTNNEKEFCRVKGLKVVNWVN
jgi:tRNA(fMet)-specific endonuclease VapC